MTTIPPRFMCNAARFLHHARAQLDAFEHALFFCDNVCFISRKVGDTVNTQKH